MLRSQLTACKQCFDQGPVFTYAYDVIQLCYVIQLSYVSEREGGGPKAVEAANAAHNILMALGTDVSHGMLPESGDRIASEQYEEDEPAKHKAPAGELQTSYCPGTLTD